MPSLGSIFVDFIARTGKYEQGVKQAQKSTTDFQRTVKAAANDISKSFENALGLDSLKQKLIAAASIGGFAYITDKSLESADAVSKMSEKLNLSLGDFQKYQYAAKLSGVDTEKFEAAIGFLNNAIADGKLPFKDTSQAIQALADKTANARDGIEKARIASEAFGDKTGRVLIPFLNQGRDGLNEMAQEADRLGLVLNDKLIKDAANFKDQVEILGEVLTKNFQAAFLEGFVGESGNLRDIYTDPRFIDGVKNIGEAFGKLAHFVADSVKVFSQAKEVLTSLAAFGIDFGEKLKLIDKDVANEALLEAGQRLSGGGSSLEGAPAKTGTGLSKTTGNFIGGGSFADIKKRADEIKSITDDLTKQNDLLQIQIDMWGQKKGAIEGAQRIREAELKLQEKGITLNDDEREQLQIKFDMLREQEDRLDALNEAAKKADETANQLGLTFSSAFEDAIVKGEKFKDVLKGVADDIFRLFIRSTVTEPAGGALKSFFKGAGGGLFGGLFSPQSQGPNLDGSAGFGGGLFSGLFNSFDVGTDYVDRDQLAYIHKGEAVLKPNDASDWRRGGDGSAGNTYHIDARGADSGTVRRLEQALVNLAGPGRIEQRVLDAQRRGGLPA